MRWTLKMTSPLWSILTHSITHLEITAKAPRLCPPLMDIKSIRASPSTSNSSCLQVGAEGLNQVISVYLHQNWLHLKNRPCVSYQTANGVHDNIQGRDMKNIRCQLA